MPVHFLDARAGQCRFPLWDETKSIGDVCGAPALAGRSYCLACYQRTRPGMTLRVPGAPRGERAPRFVSDDVTPDLVELVA